MSRLCDRAVGERRRLLVRLLEFRGAELRVVAEDRAHVVRLGGAGGAGNRAVGEGDRLLVRLLELRRAELRVIAERRGHVDLLRRACRLRDRAIGKLLCFLV